MSNDQIIDGIDVSYANGDVDWPTIAKDNDLKFVMARASHGGHGNDDMRTDTHAIRNKDGMRQSFPSAHRGFYHFLGTSDPGLQAKYFRSVVGDLQPGEFVMLDVEPDDGARIGMQPVEQIVATLEAIEQEFGVLPGVYIGAYYTGSNDPRLARFPLFLPEYHSEEHMRSTESKMGRDAVVWQWSGEGHVSGMNGAVDVNRIMDATAFGTMIAGGEGAPTAPPAPPTEKPTTGGGSISSADYTVERNDSWWEIAEREMGSGQRSGELASFNGKSTTDVIHPGDVLKIPAIS